MQGARSKEGILDAAERLMSAKGYAATSISDLARESGLPASSIYWHFASKQGVVAAVMERGAHRFFAEGVDVARAATGSPRERLASLYGTDGSIVAAHPRFLRLLLLLMLGEGGHEQDEVVDRVRARGRELLRNGLARAYREWGEELSQHVADELADLALAMFDGYFVAVEATTDTVRAGLFERMIEAIHAQAEIIRAAEPLAGDRTTDS